MPPPRERALAGSFSWAEAWPTGRPVDDVDPADLIPVVLPLVPAGSEVIALCPDAEPDDLDQQIGVLFGRHGHLVATLLELTGQHAGLPGWLEYGWVQEHNDGAPRVWIDMSFEEPAHADLTDLAVTHGRVLRYPPRIRMFDPPAVAPFTDTAPASVTWHPGPRPNGRATIDLTNFPHLPTLAGPPVDLTPRVGDRVVTDELVTAYVPLDHVPWRRTHSVSALRSHLGANVPTLAATLEGTGLWFAWCNQDNGVSAPVDGWVYDGFATVGRIRNDLGVPITDDRTAYATIDRTYEVDADGAVAMFDRPVFSRQQVASRTSARLRAVAAARTRALGARRSYLARISALGRTPALVDLFDPVEIYLRDQWVCRLCHHPVDPDALWPSDRAATLDHVHPISDGGDHTRANTQLTHWSCNRSKGARAPDDGGSADPT